MGSVFAFLGKVLSSPHGNLFTVRLASTLLLTKLEIVGLGARLLGPLLQGALGLFLDHGILLIDLTLDSWREGKKLEEFKVEAAKAYEYATKKVYDEATKQKIREQYLDLISKIGAVGDGPK